MPRDWIRVDDLDFANGRADHAILTFAPQGPATEIDRRCEALAAVADGETIARRIDDLAVLDQQFGAASLVLLVLGDQRDAAASLPRLGADDLCVANADVENRIRAIVGELNAVGDGVL